jgi:hypothetical protein
MLHKGQTCHGGHVKLRSRTAGNQERNHVWSKRELDELVENATVDCHNESEQACGLYTAIAENLALPFETKVLGTSALVTRLHFTVRDEIVASCKRGREVRKLRLIDLPLPSPPPRGAEWIAAYRHWLQQ